MSDREALIDVIQQAMLEELKKGDRDPDRSFSAAVLKAIEEDHLIIPKSEGIIALNPMSSAPRDKWIILYNEFTGFWLSKWSDEKKSYPLYDFEFSDGVWYPGPSGWLSLCHQPKAAIFSKRTVSDKPLPDLSNAFVEHEAPEDSFIRDSEIACPVCGGSGHKDDIPQNGLASLVKPLEWDDLGNNKLRSGPYSITLRGDGKYRVRFRKKVICDAVNDLRRAKSIANERNISRVLHLLTIKEDQ